MCEVEAYLQIDHRLADDAEAEVPRLDDARVNRADWNFIDAFSADGQKREGLAVVLEIVARRGVLAQREVIFRPKRVSHERPLIRMANGFDSEQIINLALKAGSGIIEGGQRGDRQTFVGHIFGRMQKPVFVVLREEMMNLEPPPVRATII